MGMPLTCHPFIPRLPRVLAGAVLLLACGPAPDSTTSASETGDTGSDSASGTTGSGTTGSATDSTSATGSSGTSVEPTTADEPGTSTATSSPGTTGELPPGVECLEDADCQIVEDCCQCAAQPIGEPFEACQQACDQMACDVTFEIEVAAACRGGRCTFVSGACTGTPACDEPPPDCEAGTIPAIAGDCWGECLAPLACEGSCIANPNDCGVGWTCVGSQAGNDRCRPVPLACNGTPTCDCMPDACEFAGCAEDGGDLYCVDGG